MSWDLSRLKEDILKLHDKKQVALLSPCLNSIVERQDYARFYFLEAKKLFNDFFTEKTSRTELVRLIFLNKSEERENFEECNFQIQAHVLSCMQNIHSVSDILSHVIYYSLGINQSNSTTLPLEKVSIYNVSRFIDNNPEYSELTEKLSKLTRHDDYKYLTAIVNHSKHRSVIKPFFNVNLQKEEGEMHEMKFREFLYKGTTFPARLVFDFLEPEFDRESYLTIEIGNEINQLVFNKI